MRKIKLLAVCVAIGLSGCASLLGRFGGIGSKPPEDKKELYIGTKLDAMGIISIPVCTFGRGGDGCSDRSAILLWPLMVVDLPLSCMADTVLLPYVLVHNHSLSERRGKE